MQPSSSTPLNVISSDNFNDENSSAALHVQTVMILKLEVCSSHPPNPYKWIEGSFMSLNWRCFFLAISVPDAK